MATHSANLQIPFERLIASLQPVTDALNLTVERKGDNGATLHLPGGALEVAPQQAGCALTLEAGDESQLTQLREAVTYYLTEQGLGERLTWRADKKAGLRPANLTTARIADSQRISPSFQRLRLEGDFARFRDGGLHFRLIFGPEGADWPVCDETGSAIWSGGPDAWHRPPYTIRAMDADAGWIDVDVVLHAGGRVTDWIAECRVGDEVALTGPGGKVPQIAGWIGYIGDETALPVIARMLDILPAETRGTACIFVPDLRDAQPLRHPEGVDLQWRLRSESDGPLTALRELSAPATDRFVFFAAEREEATAAREHLAAAGYGRGEFLAAAYWTAGWVPPDHQISRVTPKRG